jgi:hypothetical protein
MIRRCEFGADLKWLTPK